MDHVREPPNKVVSGAIDHSVIVEALAVPTFNDRYDRNGLAVAAGCIAEYLLAETIDKMPHIHLCLVRRENEVH